MPGYFETIEVSPHGPNGKGDIWSGPTLEYKWVETYGPPVPTELIGSVDIWSDPKPVSGLGNLALRDEDWQAYRREQIENELHGVPYVDPR